MKIEKNVKIIEIYYFKDYSGIENRTIVMNSGKLDYVWNTTSNKASTLLKGEKYILKAEKKEEVGTRDANITSYKVSNCTLKKIKGEE